MKKRGFFVTLDGGDGAGKSYQAAALRGELEAQGVPVLLCRDPGSTRLGEKVREILLQSENVEISTASEIFLFMAARAQMVDELILPALAEGKLVIADRFFLSTVVYQGYAWGANPADIIDIAKIAVQNRFPDLTILLDLPPEDGMARIDRPLDRMEKKGLEFHRKVRDGFLKGAELLSRNYEAKVAVIDASQPKEAVSSRIFDVVMRARDEMPR